MELKLGKTYKTRGGEIVTIHHIDDDGDATMNGHHQVWKSDGTVWGEEGDESNDYIVSEYPNTPTDAYTRILEAMLGQDLVVVAKRISEAV